ncbi:hypothetical protein LOTGIDRAFT_237438 [Lottia gigantea]|uniref:Uncharacterized protein n=1 Tax=Lottia gigantea TaxID=225164 RepID=V4B9T2_LOTGI|nr:hypothetical protein LOTGIDRAFT_237438 [Lottia gigantea]ESP04251.1 hypothetical protein LOTGIDRAFT_237438 [Lottia gigantea]
MECPLGRVCELYCLVLCRVWLGYELRSDCPEEWLKYHNECYHPLPEFLKIYSPEAKERFCRVVLSADIGYVNGVLSCLHDFKGTSNVLVKILDNSVNKRVVVMQIGEARHMPMRLQDRHSNPS